MIYDVNSAYFKAYLSKSGGDRGAQSGAVLRLAKAAAKAFAPQGVKPTSA